MVVFINYYARKTGAIFERILTNSGYTVWNCYACKAGAIIERQITNGGYTIPDCYAGKAVATIERPIANGGYAITGGGYRRNFNIGIGTSTDTSYIAGTVTV